MTAHDERDVETVSARVHEAWMEAKRAQGVTSRPSEWGEEQMVPYADLSERAKDLDRSSVRAALAALDLPGRERRAYESGVQRGRRHVPGPHIPIPQPDYTTLLNERREARAAELDPEEKP